MSRLQPRVDLRRGVVVATTDGLRVNCDGATMDAAWLGVACPEPGQVVDVLAVGSERFVLSASPLPKPALGTVVGEPAGGLIPVNTGSTALVQALYLGEPPTLGTRVLLLWQGTTPWILPGAPSGEPSGIDTPIPQPPPSDTQPDEIIVMATQSGTWSQQQSSAGTSGGMWLEDDTVMYLLIPGPQYALSWTGCWWYGAGLDQFTGDETSYSVEFWLPAPTPALSGVGIQGTLGLLAGDEPTPTGPTWPVDQRFPVATETDWPGGWIPLTSPTILYHMAEEGTRGFGITGNSARETCFLGVSQDPMSGALRIRRNDA
jgi:hypothetical protein